MASDIDSAPKAAEHNLKNRLGLIKFGNYDSNEKKTHDLKNNYRFFKMEKAKDKRQ